MQMRVIIGAAAVLASMLWPAGRADAGERAVDFAQQIKPILANRCINCHHTDALFGELSLENRAHAFKKRKAGPVIVTGEPYRSRLFLVLSFPASDQKAMPPTGHRIPDADKELIRQWIEQGAKWPKGEDGVIKPSAVQKAKSPS